MGCHTVMVGICTIGDNIIIYSDIIIRQEIQKRGLIMLY